MKDLLSSMIRGFGWGVGLCLSLLLAYLIYDTFYETPQETTELTQEKLTKSLLGPARIDPQGQAQINTKIDRIVILSGKIRIIGSITNN